MDQQALTGGFTAPPQQSAHAFRAALNAMARPGTIEHISGGSAPAPVSPAAATLLLTLADGETPIYLAPGHNNAATRDWVAFHLGAPLCDRAQAVFALGDWDALLPLSDYPIGTAEYPDRNTTLIVEMPALAARGAMLSGPGIQDKALISLPEIAAFQANHALFPQGLDFYFTAGTQVAALPRSTRVSEGK